MFIGYFCFFEYPMASVNVRYPSVGLCGPAQLPIVAGVRRCSSFEDCPLAEEID
jgi:hypothetical protein